MKLKYYVNVVVLVAVMWILIGCTQDDRIFTDGASLVQHRLDSDAYTLVNDFDGLESYLLEMILNFEAEGLVQMKDTQSISMRKAKKSFGKATEQVKNVPGYRDLRYTVGFQIQEDQVSITIDYKSNVEYYRTAHDAAQVVLDQIIHDSMSDYERSLVIHDYLIENCIYPQEFNYNDKNLFNMYGPLIDGRAVCSGYADAFYYLANQAGVDTLFVVGHSRGVGHAWNMVRLDGEWYHVDVTWDDPRSEIGEILSHTYFCLTTEEISRTHDYETDDYPVAESLKYNYHQMNGYVVSSLEEFENQLEVAFREKKIAYQVKLDCLASDGDVNQVLNSFESGTYKSISFTYDEEVRLFKLVEIEYY